MGKRKARQFIPVIIIKRRRFQRDNRDRFAVPASKDLRIPAQTLVLAVRQPRAGLADGQQSHRRITAAARLLVVPHPHQYKSATLPESPEFGGITKTDGEIVALA